MTTKAGFTCTHKNRMQMYGFFYKKKLAISLFLETHSRICSNLYQLQAVLRYSRHENMKASIIIFLEL